MGEQMREQEPAPPSFRKKGEIEMTNVEMFRVEETWLTPDPLADAITNHGIDAFNAAFQRRESERRESDSRESVPRGSDSRESEQREYGLHESE